MKRTIIKSVFIIGIIMTLIFILTTVSNAALNISVSKSSVSPGETFNVTVSVNDNEAGAINLSATNGTLGSTDIDLMSQTSVTVNCTAGNSGTISINASGKVANYTPPESETNQTASKNVSIITPQLVTPPVSDPVTPTTTSEPSTNSGTSSKSSNANLKALSISPSSLNQTFKSGTTSYTTTVESDVEKITVNATPADSKASVKVSGNTKLEEGTNTIKIVVTAENGATKTYKIVATKKAKEEEVIPNVLDELPQEEVVLGLSILEITGITLNPEFNKDIYQYSITLTENLDKLEITALPTIENATVEIIGNESLKIGENLITILLKTEDGKQIISYQLNVNKLDAAVLGAVSDDNNSIFKSLSKTVLIGIIAILVVTLGTITFLVLKYIKQLKKVSVYDEPEEAVLTNYSSNKKGKGKRFS